MELVRLTDIDLQDVKYVFSDLDNTLYSYGPCHQYALEECFLKVSSFFKDFDSFSLKYRASRDAITKRLSPQGACRSRLLAFISLFEEEKLSAPYSLALEMDELYWGTFITQMELSNDASQFIQTCREKKIKICLVTDMITNIQILKIKKLGIEQDVAFLVTSEEVGEEKPGRPIFEEAIRKTGASLQEVIFVGDDLKKDYLGAKNFGMKSYWVKCE